MNYTAIIVDDEPLGRERLSTLLAGEADIEILAECANGPAALAAIAQRMPDILFLDVQMPEMNGFAVLKQLPKPPAVVIFVTAFDEHAVNAFEVHALDYLLKPFKPARLRSALVRAREQLAKKETKDDATERLLAMLDSRLNTGAGAKTSGGGTAGPGQGATAGTGTAAGSDGAEGEPAQAHVTRFAVRDRDRTRFVKVTDIDWIEASGNYVVIHAGKDNFVLRETLAAVEAQVSPKEFFRMNRSALARLDRVREVEPAFNDEHVVVLTTGAKIPLTRGVRELQERLKFA